MECSDQVFTVEDSTALRISKEVGFGDRDRDEFKMAFLLGEMVIEYAGELIRSTLTDKRERYYDGKGIGCYMFKIDENLVVDATMRGNAARFINHSCEVGSLFCLS